MPDTVLDVIVDNPAVDQRVLSLQMQQQEAPPVRPQPPPPPSYESAIEVDIASSQSVHPTSSSSSVSNVSSTARSTVRRAPVYGTGEATTDNHSHINRSSPAISPVRVPQVVLHQQSGTITDHNDRQSQSNSGSTESQSPGGRQSAMAHTPPTISTPTQAERIIAQATNRANHNDKRAQVILGDMYRDGKGAPLDYKLAMEWYRKAAAQGYPAGQHRVGNMYVLGLGVNQNFTEAKCWHLKAAKQGYPASQHFIGDEHYIGRGMFHSFAQAVVWYLKAASQGYPRSQYNVGLLYNIGQGVAQDYVKAMEWYLKAATQGDMDSQFSIGFLYHHGQGVVQDYVKAAKWYRKAANQGDSSAKRALEYLNSFGVVG